MSGFTLETSVLTFILVLVRVTTFLAVLPFLGRRMIPGLVLIGLSLAVSFNWFSSLSGPPDYLLNRESVFLGWFGFFLATGSEFLTGAMLGLSMGLIIYPLQVAGSYLAQEMGLSMASLSDPSTQANSDVVASLLQTVGLLLLFSLNLHYYLFLLLSDSFQFIPLGGVAYLTQSSSLMAFELLPFTEQFGLSLIAPIGICLFVTLVILILLTKVAPTMNIFSIGLTIRVAGGLLFLFLFFERLVVAMQYWIETSLDSLREMLYRMAGS